MIIQITSKLIKRVPYLRPIIQGIEINLDAKKIIESSTPLGATKIVTGRFFKDYTPSEILLAGKCLIPLGGVIASVGTTGNLLVVSRTMSMSAARSRISTQPLSHTSWPNKKAQNRIIIIFYFSILFKLRTYAFAVPFLTDLNVR